MLASMLSRRGRLWMLGGTSSVHAGETCGFCLNAFSGVATLRPAVRVTSLFSSPESSMMLVLNQINLMLTIFVERNPNRKKTIQNFVSLLPDLFFWKADDLRLFISFGKLLSFGSSFPLITPASSSERPTQISFSKITEGYK